jgi:hypothetical protein
MPPSPVKADVFSGKRRIIADFKFEDYSLRESVWNYSNMMGVLGAFKSESILPIVNPKRY